MKSARSMFAVALASLVASVPLAAADGDALLGHELRRLHSPETVKLERYAGQPLLIVNTASHCGFTDQFEGLEAVHKEYADKGLKVLGFSSDDFNQEAKDEAKAAEVCFVNFGVTFDMFATIPVRGERAHPLFRELARQSGEEPQWNFHKYVVDREGRVVAAFPSRVEPGAPQLRETIERVL
ncbi:MAG: glutathione peroxidase [Azoarcus sp.]|nr:glutathione peroxidase [Azoarcus sp.]